MLASSFADSKVYKCFGIAKKGSNEGVVYPGPYGADFGVRNNLESKESPLDYWPGAWINTADAIICEKRGGLSAVEARKILENKERISCYWKGTPRNMAKKNSSTPTDLKKQRPRASIRLKRERVKNETQ